MTSPTARDLALIRELLAVVARTINFDEVTKWLGELPGRPRPVEQTDWGASYQIQRDAVSELIVQIDRLEPGQARLHSPRVVAIQVIFKPNKVRLSDLEATFGTWYRDPPDGEEASLATAYFNAKLVNPSANYFLLATTGAGYEKTLSKLEYVQTLAASWSDHRYSSSGRPW